MAMGGHGWPWVTSMRPARRDMATLKARRARLSSVSIYYSMKLPPVQHDRCCDRVQVRKHLSKASRGITVLPCEENEPGSTTNRFGVTLNHRCIACRFSACRNKLRLLGDTG